MASRIGPGSRWGLPSLRVWLSNTSLLSFLIVDIGVLRQFVVVEMGISNGVAGVGFMKAINRSFALEIPNNLV
jgi:hypothetical protein